MITLHKPSFEELSFRRELLADPATMSYNHAWGGVIDFPPERWQNWYEKWLGTEPNCFYRYVLDEQGTFLGEAAWHYDSSRQIFLCDVIIHAAFRGRGYGTQALLLLCDEARKAGISELYDQIAADNPALQLFCTCGFTEVARTVDSVLVRSYL